MFAGICDSVVVYSFSKIKRRIEDMKRITWEALNRYQEKLKKAKSRKSAFRYIYILFKKHRCIRRKHWDEFANYIDFLFR